MTNWKRAAAGLSAGTSYVLLLSAACGGPSKPADSPVTCPDGTVLSGSNCVPPDSANDAPKEGESSSPPTPAKSPSDDLPKSATGDDKSGDHPVSAPASGGEETASKTPYDRDSVEVELKRGARQIKANCGAATDDNGEANGPWGKTKASIVLGRNGHVRQVTVPTPFDGQPVGLCVIHSFDKIQFPPYANPSDVTVDWDVEIVQPKH